MATAIVISLMLAALTALYFLLAHLENFFVRRRLLDGLGAAWSLAMALWFGYAAAWVLLHANCV